MDFEIMKLNGSPFYKKSYHDKYKHGDAQISKSVRIPKTLYNDLEFYFKGMGFKDYSDGVKNILIEKMESINTFKQTCFNNIELIMLIPKTSTIKELNEKSLILTLYNADLDFFDSLYNHKGFKKTPFNIRYDLKTFCEDDFNLGMLLYLNRSDAVFGIQQKDMTDWESFMNELNKKQKKGLMNQGIDLNDCYFVRFPLNNYLDVKLDGQYQHPKVKGFHEGVYIFEEFGFRRFYFLLRWQYNGNDLISFNSRFISKTEFLRVIQNADYKPLRESYENINHSDYDKEELDRLIKENDEHGEFLRRLRSKI